MTTIQAIAADNLKKTYFGVIASLSELFTDFIYAVEYRPAVGGTAYDAPDGYYFMASKHPGIATWAEGVCQRRVKPLYAKPSAAVYKAMMYRCMEGRIGSFEIIPWPHCGHALVVGRDSTGIANVWLAFIPLDALPVIDATNTPIHASTK